jgi:hypothetical protein
MNRDPGPVLEAHPRIEAVPSFILRSYHYLDLAGPSVGEPIEDSLGQRPSDPM